MRIVMVYQHFLVSGVGSTRPYDLARHLVRSGHQVTVICGRGFLTQGVDVPRGLVRRLRIDGIEVLCLGVDYQQRMSVGRRIAAFLAFTVLAMLGACLLPRYDVLLASSTPLTVGLVGLAARYVRRVPFVFELRDLWPEVPFRAGFLRSRTLFRLSTVFEEWFYREAAAVCAVSEGMVRRLAERGVPRWKLRFIPLGADLTGFDVEADADFRRRHGLELAFIGVYIGAHGRVNGLGHLLAAGEELRDDAAIRLVLIGSGSEKQAMMDAAEARGLLGHPLVFLPPVPRHQVPGILRACDVGLMSTSPRPGLEYTMANKFFDYLAAGLPVLVNARVELGQWLARHDCGMVLDPDRPEELGAAMRRLRDDKPLARRLGRNARRLAEREFDRSKLNRQWEQTLQRASRKGPPGRPGRGGDG